MHSVLARARDQSRFEAPEIEPEREKAAFPWRTVLVLFATVLALAVAAGAVYALFLREPEVDPAVIVQPTGGEETQRIRTPQEAVTEYLEALAAGDIATALSLGEVGGIGSTTLLDPDVHAAMREEAPIENIRILTEDENATEVDVSYTLAGEEVTTSIPVVLSDNGSYELERTTVTVIIELNQAEALPLLVNGVEVQHFAPIEVVPGQYELSTGLGFIDYPEENSFTIGSLGFAAETSFTATPRLTSEGTDALLGAVRESLDSCFAQQALAPEGCPQAISSPVPVNTSTIRWQLHGNPLAEATPSLTTEDQTVATVGLQLSYTVSFQFSDGSTSGDNSGTLSVRAEANMLGEATEEISVVWHG